MKRKYWRANAKACSSSTTLHALIFTTCSTPTPKAKALATPISKNGAIETTSSRSSNWATPSNKTMHFRPKPCVWATKKSCCSKQVSLQGAKITGPSMTAFVDVSYFLYTPYRARWLHLVVAYCAKPTNWPNM